MPVLVCGTGILPVSVGGTGILPIEFVEQASCLFNLWNRHLACLVCGTGILPVLASTLDRQEKVSYKQQT
ncbi:hypothetical protein [Microcoleus sp. B13-B6]|uniref:hypothetical protein n=1 Tax=Microcoleus sp. B13-B6 TaxID=2818652 RepID=UPI002FD1014C